MRNDLSDQLIVTTVNKLVNEREEPMQALVVGVGGGIGSKVAELWSHDPHFDTVWAVSRESRSLLTPTSSVRELSTDHTETSIAKTLEQVFEHSARLARVVIALGTLHGSTYSPEKSLDSLHSESMQELYRVNCVLPMLWLSAIASGLRKNPDCRVAVLSARVGSISDNGLGGWYSYRSAKAALNMSLKCAAIEMARRAKGVKLISFHPGTVDTALSEPFQRGVPEGKLFSAEFVAKRLDALLDAHESDGELSYLDWAGATIPW